MRTEQQRRRLQDVMAAASVERQRLMDKQSPADQFAAASWSESASSYRIRMAGPLVQVSASDLPALARLESMVQEGSIALSDDVDLTSTAATRWRSVNECFYGPLWTPQARAAVLESCQRRGCNAYVYGPSADTLTGGDWAQLYAGQQRCDLEGFVEDAKELGVTPIWRVSPSAPLETRKGIDLSSDASIEQLAKKCADVLDMGFSGLLIAFDDIATDSVKAVGDRQQAVKLQARIVNRIAQLFPGVLVIACPTHYWGVGPSLYRRLFGEELLPGIPMVWTGPNVISLRITLQEANLVRQEQQHPVWLWDNFPVNDWDAPAQADLNSPPSPGLDNFVTPRHLPLAPVRGRSSVPAGVVAFGANAAMGAHYSIPALQTAMDCAWQGDSYQPDQSWRLALARTGADPVSLATLADATGPHPGADDLRVPELAGRCADVLAAVWRGGLADGGVLETLDQLDEVVKRNVDAIIALRRAPVPLTQEAWPWLAELARQCEMAALSTRLLRGQKGADEAIRQLSSLIARAPSVSCALDGATPLAQLARSQVFGTPPGLPFANG